MRAGGPPHPATPGTLAKLEDHDALLTKRLGLEVRPAEALEAHGPLEAARDSDRRAVGLEGKHPAYQRHLHLVSRRLAPVGGAPPALPSIPQPGGREALTHGGPETTEGARGPEARGTLCPPRGVGPTDRRC